MERQSTPSGVIDGDISEHRVPGEVKVEFDLEADVAEEVNVKGGKEEAVKNFSYSLRAHRTFLSRGRARRRRSACCR